MIDGCVCEETVHFMESRKQQGEAENRVHTPKTSSPVTWFFPLGPTFHGVYHSLPQHEWVTPLWIDLMIP